MSRLVVGALGALVGVARVEHGIGEVLQGSGGPDGSTDPAREMVERSW